jgi:sulfite dehydrogenase (cytochrome) subunit B
MLRPIALLVFVFAVLPVRAEEQPIELKKAPGADMVEIQCSACHSLDYIQMNSPFMKPGTWQAEVTKMIKTFGADISDEDAKTITDYLVRNYGASGAS